MTWEAEYLQKELVPEPIQKKTPDAAKLGLSLKMTELLISASFLLGIQWVKSKVALLYRHLAYCIRDYSVRVSEVPERQS